jgi:hypothetical protein
MLDKKRLKRESLSCYPGVYMTYLGDGRAQWTILTFLLLAVARTEARPVSTSDPSDRKPAWKWTTEERLTKRFDPEAMAARARGQAAEREAANARRPNLADDPLYKVDGLGGPPMEVIEGRKTPELFLPWELFSDLLDRGLAADGSVRSGVRERIEARAAALGFGQDLWTRLEKAAAHFNELRREAHLRSLTERTGPPAKATEGFKMNSEGLRLCRTRAQALAAAKAEFGEEAFLRLLFMKGWLPISILLECWPRAWPSTSGSWKAVANDSVSWFQAPLRFSDEAL